MKVSPWFHRQFTEILWHITAISPRKNTDLGDFLLKASVRTVWYFPRKGVFRSHPFYSSIDLTSPRNNVYVWIVLGKCHADYMLRTLKLVEAVLMHISGMFEGQPFYTLIFWYFRKSAHRIVLSSYFHLPDSFVCNFALVNISVAKIQQSL